MEIIRINRFQELMQLTFSRMISSLHLTHREMFKFWILFPIIQRTGGIRRTALAAVEEVILTK
jgi:hypothetical protein